MLEHDIRIRIAGEGLAFVYEGLAFVYSIYRESILIETGEVPAGDSLSEAVEEVAPGYYGGSEVMD